MKVFLVSLLLGICFFLIGCATTPSQVMEPSLMSDTEKAQALIPTTRDGDTEKVRALLAEGVDVNVTDHAGNTALNYAAGYGLTDIVQDLLANGADVHPKNVHGNTALIAAAWNGHTDIVQALLAKGADVNAKNIWGGTALIVAAEGGYTNTVQVLLAEGADVNAKNTHGKTALMVAARAFTDTVQVLLAKGADVNAKDNAGRTALMEAKKSGHKEMVQILKKAGAKPTAGLEQKDKKDVWDLETKASHASLYSKRGVVWHNKGDYVRAISDYNKALEIAPRDLLALNGKAWLLATCPDTRYRDGVKAVGLAKKAAELAPQNSGVMDTLAAAYAEAGRFEDAITIQEKALAQLKKEGAPRNRIDKLKERLNTYKEHKPWRER